MHENEALFFETRLVAHLFARITLIFELNTPKLTFPPSFINFLLGEPLPPSPPGLQSLDSNLKIIGPQKAKL